MTTICLELLIQVTAGALHPCPTGYRGHTRPHFACWDLRLLSPDPADGVVLLAGLHSLRTWLSPPCGKIKFPPVFPHAAANGGMPGCVLRNNGWRKQQSLPVAMECYKTISPAGSLMQQEQHEVHPGQTWAFRTTCVALMSLLGLLSHRLHTG